VAQGGRGEHGGMEVPRAKVTKTTAQEADGGFGFTSEQLRRKYGESRLV